MLIHFVDVEASAGSRMGYPIEIGWACLDLEGGSIARTGFLIRHQSWLDEGLWDPAAEAVHRITKDMIQADGISVGEAAERMNGALAGWVAYSDAPGFDGGWIDQVFLVAGIERGFQVLHVNEIFTQPPVTSLGLAFAEVQAARLAPHTHRAADDALHLAVTYQLACG